MKEPARLCSCEIVIEISMMYELASKMENSYRIRKGLGLFSRRILVNTFCRCFVLFSLVSRRVALNSDNLCIRIA
jgi:hypothetical protein